MNKLRNLIPLFLCLYLLGVISIQCSRNTSTMYPTNASIPGDYLYKKQMDYKKKFGSIPDQIDTVLYFNKLKIRYQNGKLAEIGNVAKRKLLRPTGYWFLYDNHGDLEYILKYSKNKVDSFYRPYGIINENW